MKKLLLDTTFVLPLFGVEIDIGYGIPKDSFKQNLKQLWKEGKENYRIFISSISLMEVMYKMNAEFRKSGDINILKRYELVLPFILSSKHVNIINSHLDLRTLPHFRRIRSLGHKDLMDCWIFGSTVAYGCVFLSEEKTLKKIVAKDERLSGIPFLNWKQFISLK